MGNGHMEALFRPPTNRMTDTSENITSPQLRYRAVKKLPQFPPLLLQTWALECDLNQEKKGPLHGVPVSIKDNFGIKVFTIISIFIIFIKAAAFLLTEESSVAH